MNPEEQLLESLFEYKNALERKYHQLSGLVKLMQDTMERQREEIEVLKSKNTILEAKNKNER